MYKGGVGVISVIPPPAPTPKSEQKQVRFALGD